MHPFFRLVSLIFHPVIMPSIGIVMLFNSEIYIQIMPFEGKRALFMIVFGTTFLFPLSLIPLLMQYRFIRNIEMKSAEERILPYIITAVSYITGFILLTKIGSPLVIVDFILGASFCVVMLLIINLKWKISAHMTGLGGLAGMLTALSVVYMANVIHDILLVLFFSGLTATARLYTDNHTPAQVYGGFMAGFISMFLSFIL